MSPLLWDAITPAYTHKLPSYTFDLSPWLGRLNSRDSNHSITLDINQQSTGSWKAAATLLLWRTDVPVTVVNPPRVVLSPNMQQPVRSSCSSNTVDQNLQECQLPLQQREMAATALLIVGKAELIAAVQYSVLAFNSSVRTNLTQFVTADGRTAITSSWKVSSSYEAAWYLGGRQGNATMLRDLLTPSPGRVPNILTQNFRRYEWMNSGVNMPNNDVKDAPFESSYNETLVVPALYGSSSSSSSSSSKGVVPVVVRGQQRHYQLSLNPGFDAAAACDQPRLSHTVSLNSSIGAGSSRGQQGSSASGCVAWRASAAYCVPQLIENVLSTDEPCPP
jgi:hypothetical protein